LHPLDHPALDAAAQLIIGEHRFLAFAVQGTAPATDSHHCVIAEARWRVIEDGLVFEIQANRFLHHMVRFLVGTMLDVGAGRRPLRDMETLLLADSNHDVSPPAPARGLCLERVVYPENLYARAA
jgi:tRNA pseudouridine38-40 synthase